MNLAIVGLAIAMALYAMKDGISYVLTAIIVALVYSVRRRFAYRRRLDEALALRARSGRGVESRGEGR